MLFRNIYNVRQEGAYGRAEKHVAVREAGAAGFLLKNTPPQDLITAIRTVHDGDSVISPGPTRRLLTAVRTGQVSGARSGEGAGRHASEDSVEVVYNGILRSNSCVKCLKNVM